MNDPAVTQKLKALMLCGSGLLLAIYLGMQIGDARYRSLLFGSVIVAVVFISFFSGRFFWVLTIASSFLGGTFPILGGSFTPFQVLMAIGIGKFLIEDVVLRRTRINTGNRVDFLLMAGFMAILTYHGVHDRFGMRFLGSNVWGGRNYVNVYVGMTAFFVVQSIPMKSRMWAKLPYLVLAVTGFDLIIAIVTTVFPKLVYTIYPFYSAVSRAGIEEAVTGSSVETARLGSFGNFGGTLITLVLASISLRQILSPNNFFRAVTLVAGFLAVLYSSFRSQVFGTLAVFLVAGIRDLKFAVLALLPFVALFLFGLSILNSEFIALPKQVQRSLTFVPGKWDTDMARDAASSNDFRRQVWTLWLQEYFPAQPLLGRGFGFRNQWAQTSVFTHDPEENRQMVEVGNIHNGFFATLDTFGIIGTIFFVIWNLRLLARTIRVPFRTDDPAGMALRFLALCLGGAIISYWMGASSVGSFLPLEFALAGVFLRLLRDNDPPPNRAPAHQPPTAENVPANLAIRSA
jgi:O-antigen ligase/polysaccharide polymerase Wzy-like membrane protein